MESGFWGHSHPVPPEATLRNIDLAPFHTRGLLRSVPETAIAGLIFFAAFTDDSLVVVCDQEGFRRIRAEHLIVQRPNRIEDKLVSVDWQGDWCSKGDHMCILVLHGIGGRVLCFRSGFLISGVGPQGLSPSQPTPGGQRRSLKSYMGNMVVLFATEILIWTMNLRSNSSPQCCPWPSWSAPS